MFVWTRHIAPFLRHIVHDLSQVAFVLHDMSQKRSDMYQGIGSTCSKMYGRFATILFSTWTICQNFLLRHIVHWLWHSLLHIIFFYNIPGPGIEPRTTACQGHVLTTTLPCQRVISPNSERNPIHLGIMEKVNRDRRQNNGRSRIVLRPTVRLKWVKRR